MFWQRLEATRVAITEQVRTVVVALMAVLSFIGTKVRWLFWTVLRTGWETLVWAVRGIFIPKVAAPLDVLKHYLLVFFMGMAVLALLWAGKQVVNPPLVITVMDLPSQLKAESWINPELPSAHQRDRAHARRRERRSGSRVRSRAESPQCRDQELGNLRSTYRSRSSLHWGPCWDSGRVKFASR